MNYEIVTNLLYKISEIQETLIQDPPSLPTNYRKTAKHKSLK